MKHNKKALIPVFEVALLLIVAILSVVIVFKWGAEFQSSWDAKTEASAGVKDLEVLSIEIYNENESVIGVKNKGSAYHLLNAVYLDGGECDLLSTNVVELVEPVYLNCSVNLSQSYEIDIYSNKGVFSKTLTVLN